jgi:hypothetical protein
MRLVNCVIHDVTDLRTLGREDPSDCRLACLLPAMLKYSTKTRRHGHRPRSGSGLRTRHD